MGLHAAPPAWIDLAHRHTDQRYTLEIERMVVASDLEGTLTTGATWRGVGRYLVAHGHAGAYRTFFLVRLPGLPLAKLGLTDAQRYRERWVEDLPRLLTHLRADELRQMSEWVVEHELWPKRRERVLADLREQQARGCQLVLASGTYQPVLEAFAGRIQAQALGTALLLRDDRVTGRIDGLINTGKVKAQALRTFLRGQPLAAAYGDTMADLPMLELSASPVAVCPDAALRNVAMQRGWRVLDDR